MAGRFAWSIVALAGVVACGPPPRIRHALPPATRPLVIADDEAFRHEPPPPLAARPHTLPAIERFALSNGLAVYLVHQDGAPFATVRLVCRRGGEDDPLAPPGLAALTIRTMVRVARLDPSTPRPLRPQGFADDEQSSIFVHAPASAVQGAIHVLAQAIERPRWDPTAFTTERTEMLRERENAGTEILYDLLRNAIFGSAHPYGRRMNGLREALEAAQPNFAQIFHHTHYLSSETALVVAGDIDRATLAAAAEAELGSWQAAVTSPRASPEIVPMVPRVMFLSVSRAVLSRIIVALPGAARRDRDYATMMLLQQLLGGLFGSRLNLSLRENLGLTYTAETASASFRDAGIMVLATRVETNVAVATLSALRAELQRLSHEPVTQSELETVQRTVRANLRSQFESSDRATDAISDLFVNDLPVDEYERLDARLAAVSRDDMQRVAQRRLVWNRAQIIVSGDQGAIGGDVERTFGATEFIPVGP